MPSSGAGAEADEAPAPGADPREPLFESQEITRSEIRLLSRAVR